MSQTCTKRSLFVACAISMALWATSSWAQQDLSRVEIRTHKLSDTTYMLVGAGGNIGLSVGADAAFVIDDQFAPMAPKIKAAIARITPKPVQFVLNTHFHFDHTGGNEAFGQDGALIVAHDNVRRRMSSDQLISFLNAPQPSAPKVALPVITVASEVRFHINGDEVHAIHVPKAHTDSDLIVHLVKSDIVHMGDIYFNGFYPFIDVSGGGTAEGAVAAADRVPALSSDTTKIIPGHGPLATKASLAAYRAMLTTVTQRIKEMRRSGKTDDEIRAAKPAAEFDAAWGGGFISAERFVVMMLGVVAK